MKTKHIKILFIFIISLLELKTNAQNKKQSAFVFSYNFQIPSGKLANTFGNNSAIGSSYFIEMSNNILFGIETNFIFGGEIKEVNIFNEISTQSGAIIGGDGRYANINLMQRGFDSYILIGYAKHQKPKNLSGIYITQGIGYMQHKIFIDTKNQNVPQLDENMKKGYDRFSNGLSTKTSLDYKYFSKSGRLQIGAGINYTVAYTKNQRVYNFAANQYYSDKRSWDKLLGFKVEIIIPVNKKNQEEFHYF